MIKVNDVQVEFNNGMTIAQVLDLSGEIVDKMTIVLVNGRVVQNDSLKNITVMDNTKISVFRLVSGG